jgi:hypothetical protein
MSSRTGLTSKYIKSSSNQGPSYINKNSTEDQAVINALVIKSTGEDVANWKDIKPDRNYMDIKKKAFIDQKKREFQ